MDIPATILLVDGSAQDRATCYHLLSQAAQYTYAILEANCGKVALEIGQQLRPDVIVVDDCLIDMTRWEFLQQWKQQSECRSIPLVILTNQSDEAVAVQMIKHGAQDYLVKSKLTSEILCHAVEAAIASQRSPDEQALNNAIIQAMPDLLIRMSRDGHYLNFFSGSAVENYGFECAHSDGSGFEALFPHLKEQKLFYTQKALDTGELQIYEQTLEVKGITHYEEVRITPCGPDEVLIIVRNITEARKAQSERQRVEDFLRESEAKHRSVLAAIPDLIFRANAEGRHLGHINHNWAYDLIPSTVDPTNQYMIEVLPPEVVQRHIACIQRALSTHELQTYEQAVQVGDRLQYEEVRAIQSGEDEVLFMIRDISDRKRAEIALRESEARFQEFMNHSPTASWITDETGYILYLSKTYLRVFQVQAETVEDLLGKTVFDLYPVEVAQQLVDNMQTVVEAQQVLETIEKIPRPDGTLGDFLVYKFPLQRTTGSCLVGGVAIDITERIRAEQSLQQFNQDLERLVEQRTADLRESEERWKLALRGSNSAIWDWNFKTNQIFFSARWQQMRGFSEKDVSLSKEVWIDQIHPHDRDRVLQSIANHLARKSPFYQEEYRVQAKDGSYIWVLSCGQALWSEDGEPIRMAGSESNITERKQAETQLLAVTRLQQAILNETDYAIISTNVDGVIQTINTAALRMLGYTADELVNQATLDLFHDPQELKQRADKLSAQWGRNITSTKNYFIARAEQGSYEDEWTYIHKDGSRIPVLLSITALHTAEGQIIGCVGFARDITQQKQIETALRKNAAHLTIAQRIAQLGSWELNLQTHEVTWSEEMFRIFGRDPEVGPLPYNEILQRIHLHDLERHNVAVRQAIEHKQPYEVEYRIYHPDGTIRHLLSRGELIVSANNQSEQLIGTILDITDRKQTNEKLLHLSERLTLALRSAKISMWELDILKQVPFWDNRMSKLYGICPSDFTGGFQDWIKALHPDDRTMAVAAFQEALRGEKDFDTEFRVIYPDGSIHFMKACALIHRNEQGIPRQMIGVNFDITDLKHAEQALQESRAMLQLVLNTIPQRVFWKDRQLTFLGCNLAFARDAGLTSPEEIFGKTDNDLPWAAFADRYRVEDTNVITTRIPKLGYEEPSIEGDGSSTWLRTSRVPLTNPNGEVIGILGSYEDITEQKRAEEQLRQTNEQLAQANLELARATRLKDEFLANMSHELRTPLNAILGMSEALLEEICGTLTERQKKAITTIEKSGNHLLELINDILDLAKIEAGKLELQTSSISIQSLCDSSLSFVKPLIAKKNLQLTAQIPPDLGYIQADERRLQQVLINLLTNAVKFTPAGGAVTLEVWLQLGEELGNEDPAMYCFSITDTGIGIAQAQLDRIFQPFVQIDSALNRHHAGTGLGLALVQRILAMHGGTLTVESEVGQGSRFTIYVPQNQGDSVSTSSDRPPTPITLPVSPALPVAAMPEGTILNTPLILLAEDNEDNIETFLEYLMEDYTLLVARNGEEAVQFAKLYQPQLILMDIQMPLVDGWEAIRQIRLDETLASVPIVALTALSTLDDREKCLKLGADAYLTKPVSLKQMLTTIQQLLN